MKKLIVSIVIALGFTSLSYSQATLRLKAGINTPNVDDFEEVEFESNVGYQFGADLILGNRLYFQPGITFEAINNTIIETNGDDFDLTVNRLKIPALIGFRLIEGAAEEKLNIRAYTGPSASFVVNEEFGTDDIDLLSDDDIEDVTWGWTVGAGLDFSMVFIDAGYKFGLNDFIEDFEGESSKYNLFYVNGGIRIGF